MKQFLIILSLLFILPGLYYAESDINKLANGIKSTYPRT
jgi:hypothetical protein